MDLDQLYSRAQELPSIPQVVQELIKSFQSGDYDVDDVAKKVSMDQVLSAKVLRMANSSRFGGHRKIASINEAVIRLGFNNLRTLVLASGFVSTFKAPPGFDLKQFWLQSFAIAELSRWMAIKSKADAETAYAAGMLSNIGRLLTHLILADRALDIDRVVEKGANRQELERESWGFTSDDVSARMAEHWKFPDEIVTALNHQSNPDASDSGVLAKLIYLAKYVHEAQSRGADDRQIISDFPTALAKAAGADLVAMLDGLEETRGLESGLEEVLG